MKKLTYVFLTFVLAISTVTLQAQTMVDDWGATSRGNGWPILNDNEDLPPSAGNCYLVAQFSENLRDHESIHAVVFGKQNTQRFFAVRLERNKLRDIRLGHRFWR